MEPAERHPVVVLFSDISNSTQLSHQLEPEEFSELLSHMRAAIDDVVPHHGGEVIRIDGDGALCIFGYPNAYEDAGRRATAAAVALHDTVRRSPFAALLRLHSGIHAGIALVSRGDLVRGRYEVLGNTTNTAARLCDAAQADSILVSESTLGSDLHFFEAQGPHHLAIPGLDMQLRAWQITGHSALPNRLSARQAHMDLGFVGREQERAVFARWLTANQRDRPIMLVHGEAGIGKSRLLEQFRHDAATAGYRTATGWCEAFLGAPTLQPFRQIAASLAGQDDTALADANALRDTLDHHLAAAPTVLILDDWQWSDDASRTLLNELLFSAQQHGHAPHVVIASRQRPLDLSFDSGEAVISLQAFADDETRLACQTLLDDPDPFLANDIARSSGGSPLLIEELCHAHKAGSSVVIQGPQSAWFDITVQARAAKLSAAALQTLRAAAAIGLYPAQWLLEDVARQRDIARIIDELIAADFLRRAPQTGTLSFKHGMTREAVYQGIARSERLALHGRILHTLRDHASRVGDSDQVIDGLAYHSLHARLGAQAVDYGIASGLAALKQSATDKAQTAVCAVLAEALQIADLAVRSQKLVKLLGIYARACLYDPSADQLAVLDQFRAAFSDLGHTDGVTRAIFWQCSISYGIGSGKRALRHIDDAQQMASALDPDDRLHGLMQMRMAQIFGITSRNHEAISIFETLTAPTAADGPALKDEALEYSALSLAFLLADRGDRAGAEAQFDRFASLRTQGELGSRISYAGFVTTAAVLYHEWDRALDLANHYRVLALDHRMRFHRAFCEALASFAQCQINGSDAAFARLVQCGTWFSNPDNSRSRCSLIYGWICEIAALRGDRTLARHYAVATLRRAREHDDRFGETMMWRSLARLEAMQGARKRAAHYMQQAEQSATRRQSDREADENRRCLRAITSH